MHPMVIGATELNIDPICTRVIDPDKSPSHNSGPDINMALRDIIGHTDPHGPHNSMILGHRHCLRYWSITWVSALPLVV